jgi:hypothetical protein
MKANEIFPSKYVKAEDISGNLLVTITDAVMEAVGPLKIEKLVLYFKEYPKPFICNLTNFKRIEKLHGDDTDNWIDKKIILYRTTTEFQGEEIPAIRVRDRAQAEKPAMQPAAITPEEPVLTDEMLKEMGY